MAGLDRFNHIEHKSFDGFSALKFNNNITGACGGTIAQ